MPQLQPHQQLYGHIFSPCLLQREGQRYFISMPQVMRFLLCITWTMSKRYQQLMKYMSISQEIQEMAGLCLYPKFLSLSSKWLLQKRWNSPAQLHFPANNLISPDLFPLMLCFIAALHFGVKGASFIAPIQVSSSCCPVVPFLSLLFCSTFLFHPYLGIQTKAVSRRFKPTEHLCRRTFLKSIILDLFFKRWAKTTESHRT